MLEVFDVLGPAARWVHLAACVGLVGIAAFLLLAGRPGTPGAHAWHARMLRWSQSLVLIAIGAGMLALVHQTSVFEGRPDAAFDPGAIGQVLFHTQVGIVWLARHALLLLLAAFLAVRMDVSRPADWFATHGQALFLAIISLGLLAASGHAAAVEPDTLRVVGIDVAHLLATGIWVGGLPALAALLRTAAREGTDEGRSYAARAARRFSQVALASVLVLAATGVANALTHIGSIAGLVGTPYGHMLLLKLALLVPILALAAVARRRLLPALGTDVRTLGRMALRRLRRVALAEAGLAATILLVVATMSVTRPSRHDQPTWPLPFRVVLDADTSAAPSSPVGAKLIRASTAYGAPSFSYVRPAYPTTYVRPAVPYTAASIVSGAALYQDNCAGCHGSRGAGDGPLARGLPKAPADLRSPRVRSHTAGDLFWWITHGIANAGMPAFGNRLRVEQSWDLVNFIRTLDAAEASQQLGPAVDSMQPWLVAPDFTFAVGPIPPQSLRDFRGSRMVFLVLYSLPESRARIREIALAIDALDLQGVEIIAVPRDAAQDAIRRLGAERGLYFSVVTDGARDIVPPYELLAGDAPHAEFLIDRQGYIRSRWTGQAGETRPIILLLEEVQRLRREQPAPPAEEHVH
jgi:putative copper resistance protein D